MVMLAPKKNGPPSPVKIGGLHSSHVWCMPISPVAFAKLMNEMPPPCQQCGCPHERDWPHDRDSLRYQFTFQQTHQRPPTWSDAMAHCSRSVRLAWRQKLRAIYAASDIELPADLVAELDPGAK